MKLGLGMVVCIGLIAVASTAFADENLFGYVKGSETLPKGAWELYEVATLRTDKGQGEYKAWNSETEVEYGVTDSLTMMGAFSLQGIDTKGLVIDGYLPKDESYGLKASGVEGSLKYNFLSPAKDVIGLSGLLGLDHSWLDPHSGQDKSSTSLDISFLFQKYFLEGQLIWVGNTGVEGTYAVRGEVTDLPADFEWTTNPEVELELKLGTGLSYRFAPEWFIGLETLYEAEHETEVGRERWSIFAGPSLHYGGSKWWTTVTWMPQLAGGGEEYADQKDSNLHLIEKTKQEFRVKVGFNF